MSKNIKKDTRPASADFVAVVSHHNPPKPEQQNTPAPLTTPASTEMNVNLTGAEIPTTLTNSNLPISGLKLGDNVSGLTTDTTYIPTETIGDLGQWQRGLIGPNPNDNSWMPGWPGWSTPVPNLPLSPTFTYTLTPPYWGVRRRDGINQGLLEFQVLSPDQMRALLPGETVLCRSENENDARAIAALLNEDYSRKQQAEWATDVKRGQQPVTYEYAAKIVKQLAGRVLTVVDAAYVHEAQSKAVKSLTKREFRDTLSSLFRYCFRMDGNAESEERLSEVNLDD